MLNCRTVRVVFVLITTLLIIQSSTTRATELKIGQKAPNFELPTIFGDSTYNSKEIFPQSALTVLIFWTSYCPDCWKALKSCHNLAEKVKEMEVHVLGINFDDEKLATVRGFIKGEKIDFVNLSDFQGKVPRSYKADVYDFSTFIVDRKGILKYVSYDHPPDVDKILLKEIQKILGEKKEQKSKELKPDKDRKV
ncbi:MAG: TlpA family protein disulfide reductase [Gemmatimonadota bacterium]|nr:MAG: TlpA family protein disulfide reductase [Gemmatimonadota bacterium]